MTPLTRFAALCAAVLLTLATVHSTTWYVHPDSALNSIQAGIDSSVNGDTVLVSPATYVENVNFNGKNIVLGSLFLTTGDTSYIRSTIIDGDSSGTVVTLENGEDSTTVLTGFTVRNGLGRPFVDGGGIRCMSSSPSITDVTISGNTASEGGGIYCQDYSSPILTNVTLSGNTANFGGGIECWSYSSPILTNVTISGNTVAGLGGGLRCDHYSSPILTNVTIEGNSATGGGGGISCELSANPTLTNVIISDNVASFAGGVYFYEAAPTLINVTISGNTASRDGGGICCRANSNPNLVNCILWNNALEEILMATGGDSNSITISYSDIQGDSAGIGNPGSATINWLDGNIDSDPLFVDTASGDFRLTESSPCIDAGTPDTTGLGLPPWDILGNHRIWDGDGNGSAIVDMGAYEYGSPAVGVEEGVVLEPPPRFSLRNYPNPFDAETKIRFSLPSSNWVCLKVRDTAGRLVRILLDEERPAGQHNIAWNGRDAVGSRVASGVYFYRFETKQHSATKKMVLLR